MPVSDYTPAVSDVGTLLRARTTDSGGNETGTFTTTTRPTSAQVQQQIQQTVEEVYPKFGQDIPDALGDEKNVLRNAARQAVALGAAAMIEVSFFPEQVATGRSPYKVYMERFDKAVLDLSKAIEEVEAGEEPAGSEDLLAMSDGFPVDEGGMVGWGTRW